MNPNPPSAPDAKTPTAIEVLRFCADVAPDFWFPSVFSRQAGIDRECLNEPVWMLVKAGLVSVAVWTKGRGQGFSLTPIQLVTLIGSIANGGKLVTPQVVEGLFDSTGVRKDKPTLPEPTQIFSPTNAQAVLEMMETVVTKGSGVKAQIPGYRIAGKTGTSQKAVRGGYGQDDQKITSFVGILPVDGQHRYVVFAAVDEPKGKEKAFGSNVAAPIVKSVMESLISIDGIPPSDPSQVKPQPKIKE